MWAVVCVTKFMTARLIFLAAVFRTCEYVDGCEWREQKAGEVIARWQEKGADAVA